MQQRWQGKAVGKDRVYENGSSKGINRAAAGQAKGKGRGNDSAKGGKGRRSSAGRGNDNPSSTRKGKHGREQAPGLAARAATWADAGEENSSFITE